MCRVVSCRVVSCRVVSCRVVSCRTVSCVVCRVSCCVLCANLNKLSQFFSKRYFRYIVTKSLNREHSAYNFNISEWIEMYVKLNLLSAKIVEPDFLQPPKLFT